MFELWNCRGCGSLAGPPVHALLGVYQPKHFHVGSPAVLASGLFPLRVLHAHMLLSYPGSGQSLTRLLLEVLSGRPTRNLYELWYGWSEMPLCRCFGPLGMLSHVRCADPPLVWAHHNSHFLTLADEDSLRSLVVLVRDYKAHIARDAPLEPTSGSSLTEWLEVFASDYFWLIDFFERFRSRKLMVFYEDLKHEGFGVAAQLSDFFALPDAARGLERWRLQYRGLMAQIASTCGDWQGTGACSAPCRSFRKTAQGGSSADRRAARWPPDMLAQAVRTFEEMACEGGAAGWQAPSLMNAYLLRQGWGSGQLLRCQGGMPVWRRHGA